MPLISPKSTKRSADLPETRARTLSLVLTKKCPLQCSYCYEKQKEEDLNFMDFEVAIKSIDYYLGLDDEFDYVMIDLFGGEPLLAFDLIKKLLDWCHSRQWKKKYRFQVGTNGVLLNNEMKEWFSMNRQNISMALSIDGNRTAHNISRDNSYDRIYPHFDFFKKHWPDQPAKMTICAETIPYMADSIIELEEMGLFFTSNTVFENIWGTEENKERLLKIYEEQLMRLADYYIEKSHLYPVYPLLGVLPHYLGIPGFEKYDKGDCVRYCGAGHEMLVVDIDGREYPCHRFLPWVSGKEAPKDLINRQSCWKPEECAQCKILHSCPTCAGFNWEVNGDTGIRTTFHCDAHKLEVLTASKIYAYRYKKISSSQLSALSPEDRRAMNERVSALLELIKNGI